MSLENLTFNKPEAAFYTPKNAAQKATVAVIGAHFDDVPIGAFGGVLDTGSVTAEGFKRNEDQGLLAIITSDCRGSANRGRFANVTKDEMRLLRREEQKQEADLGEYAGVAMLDYSSAELKGGKDEDILKAAGDIKKLLLESQPETVYLHAPFDRHETHLSSTLPALIALEQLRNEGKYVPKKVLGYEVWGNHDFVGKVIDPEIQKRNGIEGLFVQRSLTHAEMDFQSKMIGCHVTQTEGSKDYVEATIGRQIANETFGEPRESNDIRGQLNMVDLMPIVRGEMTVTDYVSRFTRAFDEQKANFAAKYCSPENYTGKEAIFATETQMTSAQQPQSEVATDGLRREAQLAQLAAHGRAA